MDNFPEHLKRLIKFAGYNKYGRNGFFKKDEIKTITPVKSYNNWRAKISLANGHEFEWGDFDAEDDVAKWREWLNRNHNLDIS